jgi:signal transduction histidine kinase
MSLGNKLTVYLLLGVLAVTGLDVYLNLAFTQANLLADLRREIAAVSRTLRASLELTAQEGAEIDFLQLANAASEFENILGVVFYDSGGRVMTRSAALRDLQLPEVNVQEAIATRSPIEGMFSRNAVQRYYRLELTANTSGGGVAAFLILEDFPLFARELRARTLQLLLSTLMLLALLAVIVSLVVRQNVSRPLQAIAHRLRAIGQGQFNQRLQLTRRDEIGQLADEFDRMCAQLETAQQNLLAEHEENLRLERALRHSEKLAALGQLASRLAHEIGTPLNVIQMRAEQLLQREHQSEKDRAFLNVIVAQIERISGFIRQLLTLARRPEPQFRVVHMNDVARRVWEIIGERGNTPGVEVKLDLAEDAPPVLGDPDQLQEVLLNLTVNALQAVGPVGQVTLSTRFSLNKNVNTSGRVEARVTDTGQGIRPEDLPHIFDPFFTTKGTKEGTGLGLAISREIVLSHHGEIYAESQALQGSCFVVCLPPVTNQLNYKAGPRLGEKGDVYADNGSQTLRADSRGGR